MTGDDDRFTIPASRSARGLYALWIIVLVLSFATGGYAFGYLVDYEGVGTANGPNVLGVVEDVGDGFANVGNTDTTSANTDSESSIGNTDTSDDSESSIGNTDTDTSDDSESSIGNMNTDDDDDTDSDDDVADTDDDTDTSVGNTAGNTQGMSIDPLIVHGVGLPQFDPLVGVRTVARAAVPPGLVVIG